MADRAANASQIRAQNQHEALFQLLGVGGLGRLAYDAQKVLFSNLV